MAADEVKMVNVNEDFEEILGLLESQKDDQIETVMKLTGRTLEEQVLASTYVFYRFGYMNYQALYEEFGEKKGFPMYMGYWFIMGDWMMQAALREMGLNTTEDVKDIPTMAELFHRTMNNYSEQNKITECSEDKAVIEVIHCSNPMLGQGPFDRFIERARYVRETDSSYEIGYGKFCSEFPNMCGLGHCVEGRLTHIMCLAEGRTCRTVFERKESEVS